MSELSRSPYITCKRRGYLSTELGMKEREVRAWFQQTRRQLCKRKAKINWQGTCNQIAPLQLGIGELCQHNFEHNR